MWVGYTLPASGLIKSTAVVIEVFPKHICFCSTWSLISRKLSYHKTRQSAVNESFQAIIAFTQRVVQSGDEFGHKRNHESLKKRYGSQYKRQVGTHMKKHLRIILFIPELSPSPKLQYQATKQSTSLGINDQP